MKSFDSLHEQYALAKFLDSANGTLYFTAGAPSDKSIVVRLFDGDLPCSLVMPFAKLTCSAQQWIERHQDLSEFISVVQPLEAGRDYIARRHFRHYASTYDCDDDEEPLQPPPQLQQLRTAFTASLHEALGECEKLITAILGRSILLPSGKTLFDEKTRKYVIVELKPTRDELEQWLAMDCSQPFAAFLRNL